LVGGTNGSGKTTLAGRVASMIGASHTEIDSLYHGPGWTVRPDFIAMFPLWAPEVTPTASQRDGPAYIKP